MFNCSFGQRFSFCDFADNFVFAEIIRDLPWFSKMGKRKNKDQDYIKKKIQKLQRKLEKIPVEVDSENSSPPCSPPARSPSPLPPAILPPVAQLTEELSPSALNIPAQNDPEQELITGLLNMKFLSSSIF